MAGDPVNEEKPEQIPQHLADMLIDPIYPFKVVHIMGLLDELHATGRIKTTGMESECLTFHDPC